MPLVRRIPKRGFHNQFALDGGDRQRRRPGDAASRRRGGHPATLKTRGLVKGQYDLLKVLGNGELTKSLKISAHQFSTAAMEKIEKAGGQAIVLPGKKPVVKSRSGYARRRRRQECAGLGSGRFGDRTEPTDPSDAASICSIPWNDGSNPCGKKFASSSRSPSCARRSSSRCCLLAVYRVGWQIPLPIVDQTRSTACSSRTSAGRRIAHSDGHVQRQQSEPGHDLRPGHHALHLGLDYLPAPGQRLSAAGKAAKGRRERPQENQRIHALRHRRPVPRAKLVLRGASLAGSKNWSTITFLNDPAIASAACSFAGRLSA